MGKRTVLIADNCASDRMQIMQCLGSIEDMDCIQASNGREALRTILSKVPDLIFLELDLTIIESFEILKTIKRSRREQVRKIPVLIFTSLKDKSIVKEVLLMGVQGYILKPSDCAQIMKKISSVVCKDEIAEMVEEKIKPRLQEIFGNALANDILSKALIVGMKSSSKHEKMKLIIESICSDQRYIGMMGTAGVRKQKDDWGKKDDWDSVMV
ncbi:response regulator [candidate division KSB1 bacterium]